MPGLPQCTAWGGGVVESWMVLHSQCVNTHFTIARFETIQKVNSIVDHSTESVDTMATFTSTFKKHR